MGGSVSATETMLKTHHTPVWREPDHKQLTVNSEDRKLSDMSMDELNEIYERAKLIEHVDNSADDL